MSNNRIVMGALIVILLVGLGIGFWLTLQDDTPPSGNSVATHNDPASDAAPLAQCADEPDKVDSPAEAESTAQDDSSVPEEQADSAGDADEPAQDIEPEPEWQENLKEFVVMGRVSFKSDDRPASGAEVRAVAGSEPDYNEWEREAQGEAGGPDRPDLQAVGQDTTDGVGLFSFTVKVTGYATTEELEQHDYAGLSTNNLRVIATFPGYAPARSDRIHTFGVEDEIEINLTLARATTLKGRAVDAATKEPIPRAWVNIQDMAGVRDGEGGRDGRRLITDEEGRFELDDLPEATWSVIVSAHGYAFWSSSSNDVEIVTRRGEAVDLGDLPLKPQLSVIGRIVDESGEPVPKVNVQLTNQDRSWSNKKGKSDDGGRFEFSGIDPGRYELFAKASGHAPVEIRDIQVAGTGRIDLGDITLPRGLTVRGSVRNRDGDGISSAHLLFKEVPTGSVFDSDKYISQTYSRRDGTYEATGLYEDEFIVEVRMNYNPTSGGYAPFRGTITVTSDRQTFDVVLGKGGSVLARILDEEGQPEEGVRVEAISHGTREYLKYRYTPHVSHIRPNAKSDENGDIELANLTPGTYLIVARTDYQRRMERDHVTVKEGEITDLGDWRFELPGHVRVTVTRSGLPVPKLEVWLAPGEGNFKSYRERVTTDSNGVAEFEDVPAGEWIVRTSTAFERNASGPTVDVRGENTADVHIELQPEDRAFLTGRLTVNGENVIRDVVLAGRGPRAGIFKRTRTGDGTFEFPSLEPGPYVLVARESRQSVPARLEITIDGTGKNEVLHDFQGYRVSGRVIVPSGDPAAFDAVSVNISRTGEEPVGTSNLVVGNTDVEPDGSFAFPRVTLGRYRISAVLDGVGAAGESIRVVSGDVGNLSLTIAENAGSLKVTIGELNGRPRRHSEAGYVELTDAEGNPVAAGARNSILLAEGAARELETVPPGRYTVRVSAPGYLPVTKQDVVVETGETTEISVDLTAGAELHLTVTNGEVTQEMLDGATVRYFGAGGQALEVVSNLFDSFGTTTAPETPTLVARYLHEGVAEVRIKIDGYLELTIPVQPQPGQKIEKQETLVAE